MAWYNYVKPHEYGNQSGLRYRGTGGGAATEAEESEGLISGGRVAGRTGQGAVEEIGLGEAIGGIGLGAGVAAGVLYGAGKAGDYMDSVIDLNKDTVYKEPGERYRDDVAEPGHDYTDPDVPPGHGHFAPVDPDGLVRDEYMDPDVLDPDWEPEPNLPGHEPGTEPVWTPSPKPPASYKPPFKPEHKVAGLKRGHVGFDSDALWYQKPFR